MKQVVNFCLRNISKQNLKTRICQQLIHYAQVILRLIRIPTTQEHQCRRLEHQNFNWESVPPFSCCKRDNVLMAVVLSHAKIPT